MDNSKERIRAIHRVIHGSWTLLQEMIS